MTVGVIKKKVKVLTASAEYSTSDPIEVYVVDTTNEDLLLATSEDTGAAADLTGNATIGSDVDAQVSIGAGGGADVLIGALLSGNSTTIRSTDINVGTGSGNHNIYLGAAVTANSDAILIGTSTKSNITIGNNAVDNSLYINSRNLTVGSRSGSTHSATTVQGNVVTTRASYSADIVADTYASIDSPSVTIDSESLTITSTSQVGITTPTLELNNSTKLSVVTPLVEVNANNIDITSTSATIRNEADATDVSRIEVTKTTLAGMPSPSYHGRTTISSSSRSALGTEALTSSLTVASDTSTGRNIYARSSSDIVLRSKDLQLSNPLANQSSFYLEMGTTQSELKYVNSAGDTDARVAVSSSGVTIGNYTGGLDTNFIRANTTSGDLECNFGSILTQSPAEITLAGTAADTLAGFENNMYVNRFFSVTGFHSVNGAYSPFTGVHMFDVQPNSNISIGDAVIVVNHTAMLTTIPNDKRVAGIVCEILENNRISVASVGDNECGQLKGFKVCNENGTISAGDLLTTSSTAGYLMKQSDDIMRSSTVGKSAVDVVFDNNNLAVDVYGFIYCG